MKLTKIVKELGLTIFCGEDALNRDVEGGYVSDLLSDVMGNGEEKQIWVTIQNHKNVVAIASLKDLAAIVLPKGLEPDEDMLRHAINEEIPVLGTDEAVFPFVGKLYAFMEEHSQ